MTHTMEIQLKRGERGQKLERLKPSNGSAEQSANLNRTDAEKVV